MLKWVFVTLIEGERRGRERLTENECAIGLLDREDTGTLYIVLSSSLFSCSYDTYTKYELFVIDISLYQQQRVNYGRQF